MKLRPMRQSLVLVVAVLALAGCVKRETRVEIGDREQILHLANGDEIEDVDPHTTTGITEHNVIAALFESLLGEDPVDLHPVPGVAERWEIAPDQITYTFHLRHNAQWSNGDPITARDFQRSFQRILTPSLAAEYANMLFPIKNAEAYYRGQIKDFNDVGARVVDDHTLVVTLKAPTPYFLGMVANHYSLWPVHIATVEKFGGLDKKGTAWTKPENFVGNGPFVLAEWRVNDIIKVKKNPRYWDAANVKLQEINFYPIQSRDTEERAFRAGQIHAGYELLPDKIPDYEKNNPKLLRIDPYLGNYFFRVNVTVPFLKDKRVRRALAMAVDRESIVKSITKGRQLPANHYTPPDTAGYNARARLPTDIEGAKKLLAEAGFPDGKGFPSLEIHFNTDERHKSIAEAIQQMWKKSLNIDVTLVNHEWKVYLDTQDTMKYQISRAGWIGDYMDPNTFLELWTTGNGNNDTGWSHAEYDRLIAQASITADQVARYELFQKAEVILMDEVPIIPIFFYTKPYNLRPSVKNWFPNSLGHHPYKHVYLEPITPTP